MADSLSDLEEEEKATAGKADVKRATRRALGGVPSAARILQLQRLGATSYVDEAGRLYVHALAQGGTPHNLATPEENEFASKVLEDNTALYPKGCSLYWVTWFHGMAPSLGVTPLNPEIDPSNPITLRARGGIQVYMLVTGNGLGESKPGTRERNSTYAVMDWRRYPSSSPPKGPT